ncbi:zinc carboxypeptidase superfamily [Cyclospora cayetanensis]|uniref:Zinc carboxypeptidase superfamily n=1 Tax=Cyclospora cayetanensis TaxID=88456 RepID=A0A1D3CU11_9EIME|nr:zinc carboxypeptidase superfamily [Cyclospora cayetanensis]
MAICPKVYLLLSLLLFPALSAGLGPPEPSELNKTPKLQEKSLEELVEQSLVSASFAKSPYVQKHLIPLLRQQPLSLLQRGSMMSGYPTLEEAALVLHALVTTYGPKLIQRHIIGQSVEGRPLQAYRVGGILRQQQQQRERDSVDADFPAVLMTGLHHSREPLSMVFCIFTIARLLEDFVAGDATAVYLLLTREWWVVPILNPDGYAAIEATGNTSIRKNRRPPPGFHRPFDDYGVDLNRNYDYHFKSIGYEFLSQGPAERRISHSGFHAFLPSSAASIPPHPRAASLTHQSARHAFPTAAFFWLCA